MTTTNEDFANQPAPKLAEKPLMTDELGNELDPFRSAFEDPAGGVGQEEEDDIGFLGSDAFAALPDEAKVAFKQRLRHNNKLEKRLEKVENLGNENATLRKQLDDMRHEIASNSNGRGGNPEKIGDFSPDALAQWKTAAWKTIRAARANPENIELQSQATAAEEGMGSVDAELSRRAAQGAVDELKAEMQANHAASAHQQAGMQYLAEQGIGTDVLVNQNNPVRTEAREAAEAVATKLGFDNSNQDVLLALEVMALSHANKRDANRAGGGIPERVRRQLDIEAGGRSSAAMASTSPTNTAVFGGSSAAEEVSQLAGWLARNGMA